MLIRMPLQRQLAIRLFNLLLSSIALHSQNLVIVLLFAPFQRGLRFMQLLFQLEITPFGH